ncbi:MAG: hypothetical protein DRI88_12770, partial [Bacteroidetes bacterium]
IVLLLIAAKMTYGALTYQPKQKENRPPANSGDETSMLSPSAANNISLNHSTVSADIFKMQ